MLTDIIVHMDREAGCTARLMAAIDLALRHRARLKGLYVITHQHYTSSSTYLSDFGQVREFFINAASKAGVEAEWLLVDWNVVGTPIHEIIVRHACSADLVLVGRPQRQDQRAALSFHEGLLLGSGRPIVAFPADGELFRFGERVLVAWKGGRESVRAVHDALPLLQQAQEVTIAAVVGTATEQHNEEQTLAELLPHLERCGVRARAEFLPLKAGGISGTLLKYAEQASSDLLVLGGAAYKTNRAPLISPLARELLFRAPLPLMLSH